MNKEEVKRTIAAHQDGRLTGGDGLTDFINESIERADDMDDLRDAMDYGIAQLRKARAAVELASATVG